MAITATFVDADTFTVVGDYQVNFVVGRKVRCNCGVDGLRYAWVLSTAFAVNTTVNLTTDSDAITVNLTEVEWSVVKPGIVSANVGVRSFKIREASGDPTITFAINDVDEFTIGVDDTDGDKFKISRGGALGVNDVIDIDSSGSVVINEGGIDANFRVEGVGQPNAVFVDGTNGFVGIWHSNPSAPLDVVRTTTVTAGVPLAVRVHMISTPSGVSTAGPQALAAFATFVGTNNQTSINSLYSSAIMEATAGTLDEAIGLDALVNHLSASGTLVVTDAIAVKARMWTSGTAFGTITNLKLIDTGGVKAPGGNLTITNAFGLYIQPIGAGTNKWGAYQAGTDPNRLGGTLFIGDDANANMTLGLTINQGANDDEIFALKSSDVAHAMTAVAETDTYAFHWKQEVAGGLNITGLTGDTTAIKLSARSVNENSAKNTAARAYIELQASKRNGAGPGITNPAANTNIVAIISGTTTRFIFDSDGESHQDVGTAWIEFDDYDDVALLGDFNKAMVACRDGVKDEFVQFLKYNRDALEQARIVHFDRENPGHAMVNTTRLSMLLVGAVQQLGRKLDTVENRLAA